MNPGESSRERILLVSPHDDVMASFEAVAKAVDVELVAVRDRDGLREFDEDSCALAILDVPSDRIASYARWMRVPIVAIVPTGDRAHIREAYRAGAIDCWETPIDVVTVVAQVRAFVAIASGTHHDSPCSVELPRCDEVGVTLAGLDVLVVEDDPDGRELLDVILTSCGAYVRTAATVKDALAEIERAWPDVVVSDIGLPCEDGYALVTKVHRLTRSCGRRLPVIALTAYTSDHDRERALAAGFEAHASKPIDPRELSRAVAAVVARAA